MKLDVLELPFDQYQRYRLASDLVNELRARGERFTILDVGGRTGLLRAFLPKDRVSLVDLEASDVEGLVLGDGSRLPFKDKCFDIVATFDTLEHVPPGRRADFVSECARVAKRWIFVIGPYQAPAVEEAEKILQRFLLDRLEVEHRYLEEHRHNGLPSLSETEKGLKKCGATVAHIGHGNLERWLALMCLSMYLDYEPRLRPLAARIFRFYNANLYASDHALPVYRHAVVGALAGAKLPHGTQNLDAPIAPREVLDRFRGVADEVVSFDRARDDWREERARLAEILATLERDLAGHRATLEEERARAREQNAVLRTLEADLTGHKKSLDEALAALATEREQGGRVRSELEGKLAKHQEQNTGLEGEVEKLTRELEGERERGAAVRAELEKDIELHRASLATVERDLEEHRALRVAQDNELAAHALVLGEERARAKEKNAVLETLEEDLAGHRKSLADALSALESEREQGGLVRAELESKLEFHQRENTGLVGEVAHLQVELQGERERGAAVRADLEADIARHRKALRAAESNLEEHRALRIAQESELAQRAAVLAAIEADLDGHRRALAETRAIVEDQRAAIEDQRRVIEDQRGVILVLTEHRARIEEALADRDKQIAALSDMRAALEADLAAHRRVLATREADLEGHKKSLAAREAELSAHRRALKALEEELARHRVDHERATRELEARLLEHRAVQADLATDLGAHKLALATVSADLDGHRRLAVDLRKQVEGAEREQARLQDELSRARQEIDGKRSEIERAGQALAENDALIGALRADLKNRWRSIKRGFGPKRPTPGEAG